MVTAARQTLGRLRPGDECLLLLVQYACSTGISINYSTVASEAYHDWSGEAADAQLRVNFMLKLLLSRNFCNRPLMRFISFASNIGPVAAVPAGPAPAPLLVHSLVPRPYPLHVLITHAIPGVVWCLWNMIVCQCYYQCCFSLFRLVV